MLCRDIRFSCENIIIPSLQVILGLFKNHFNKAKRASAFICVICILFRLDNAIERT